MADTFLDTIKQPVRSQNDFINIIREIRGSAEDIVAAAEDPTCIYGDIVARTRVFTEQYGEFIADIDGLVSIHDDIVSVASISTDVSSVADNMAELLLVDTNAAIASTKAVEASNSADTTAVYRDQALAALQSTIGIFDTFDDRFLGVKTVDPTTDNDGDALVAGTIYYNSNTEEVRFYNGATWDSPDSAAAQSAQEASDSAASALAAQVVTEGLVSTKLDKAGDTMAGDLVLEGTNPKITIDSVYGGSIEMKTDAAQNLTIRHVYDNGLLPGTAGQAVVVQNTSSEANVAAIVSGGEIYAIGGVDSSVADAKLVWHEGNVPSPMEDTGAVMSGNIGRSSHSSGYMVGSYNNVGANGSQTNPIYTIGTNFMPSDTDLGNMYGIGYTDDAAAFINATDLGVDKAFGWGQYVAANGNARIFLSGALGDGAFKGNLYAENQVLRGDLEINKGVSLTTPNTTYLVRPTGGEYYAPSTTMTGYIKVTLPQTWTNTMMSMDITIFDYAGGDNGESVVLTVGGYDSSTPLWRNVFATVRTGRTDRFYNVQFGHDGTNCAIYIGNESSTWSYVKVNVSNFYGSHAGGDALSWRDPWDIEVTDTLGDITASIVSGNVASYALEAGWADSVDVNSNNTSDVWHDVVWHSGDSVYSSAGVEIQGSTNGLRAGTLTETSARKYKENITQLTDCLHSVMKMDPVLYNVIGQDATQIGLIADDVDSVRPEYVMRVDGEVEGLHYQRIVADLIGAVKEQQVQIEELQTQVKELQEGATNG